MPFKSPAISCHQPSRSISSPARSGMLALIALACALPATLHAQRLPTLVTPEHYTLALTPDLKAATFTGQETIDVVLAAPSDTITLNAAELQFKTVAATWASAEAVTATVSLDPGKEQATFTFPTRLPATRVKLAITYSGILNNDLRGFYLSRTAQRNYAVTQFESTDARRAFPSFDEPAFKATYDLALTVAASDTVIANTNVISDRPAGPGLHTITFATTPKMSTYLVAFLVGDFKCVSGESDGTPIRACAVPGQEQKGRFAVQAAEYILHFYNTYFGIKYPMPKLDMIAIPDFEAGAMENFGAITYRETDLLIDEKTASLSQKKEVASVVAHEMAHQWFGDMVTMQWWDNVWLNEGFATWMAPKPVAKWHPEWHTSQDVAVTLDTTLNLDSTPATHPIRATADTPSQIDEMFDGISYGKGGAVLAMVENYLGAETFRNGVHNYLAAHLYANATAEDFWNAQTSTSGKPIDRIMESFVAQAGAPLVSLSVSGAQGVTGAQVSATASRFFLNPASAPPSAAQQGWTIPICFKAAAGSCQLLEAGHAPRPLTAPEGHLLFADAGAKGFYRTLYPRAVASNIVAQAESSLTPEERISLIGNQWAMVPSGHGEVGDYLSLVAAMRAEPQATVLNTALLKVDTIKSRIASDQQRKQLSAWLRQEFSPAYQALGPLTVGESQDKNQMRAILFGFLGRADDPVVLAEAKAMAERYLADPASINANLVDPALRVGVRHGDAAMYDQLLALARQTSDPTVRTKAVNLTARFEAPPLVARTLDSIAEGKVRNQDSWALLVLLLENQETRDQTWSYIKQNWDKVSAQFTANSGNRVVAATGEFCSAEKREDVVTFFTTHKVMAAERTLKQAADKINDCIALRQAQQPNLQRWLANQNLPRH